MRIFFTVVLVQRLNDRLEQGTESSCGPTPLLPAGKGSGASALQSCTSTQPENSHWLLLQAMALLRAENA